MKVENEMITFEDQDEFERRGFAERMIRLLNSDIDVSPLVIEGDWGTGKTVFCKKTIKLINSIEEKTKAIYLDAFSEDYYEQPLLSLLIAVYQAFPAEEDRQKLTDTMTKLVKVIGKGGIHVAINKLLGPECGDVLKTLKELWADEEQACYQRVFEERARIGETLDLLKEQITELTKNFHLIVFIDELDRCRPTFALQLLEAVKHLFGIENLKFVFLINKKQLIYSIQHAYGNDEEVAKRYLDKFFAIKLQLPKVVENPQGQTNGDKFITTSVIYFRNLLNDKSLSLSKTPLFDGSVIPSLLLEELIVKFDLSLRDVEKLIRYLTVYQTLYPQKSLCDGYKMIVVFLVFSFARGATWIKDFEESPNYSVLNEDLKPKYVEKHTLSFLEQLSSVLYAENDEHIRHLFNYITPDLKYDRRPFFREKLKELQTFSA